MSDSRDIFDLHEEHLEESASETDAILKYTEATSLIKNAEENINVRNSYLYGNVQNNQDLDIEVADVLSQIVQDVTVFESSTFSTNQYCRKSKNDVTQSEFLSLNEIQSNEIIINNANKPNFESQWDCNTQLAALADNADALDSMINSSNIQLNESLFEKRCVDLEINDNFKGFTTASNKNIEISKEALSKVENIFKGIESDGNNDVCDLFDDDIFNDNSQKSNRELIDEFENEKWSQSNGLVKINSDKFMNTEMHIMNEDVELKNMDMAESIVPEIYSQPSSPIISQASNIKKKKRVAIIYKNTNLNEPVLKKVKGNETDLIEVPNIKLFDNTDSKDLIDENIKKANDPLDDDLSQFYNFLSIDDEKLIETEVSNTVKDMLNKIDETPATKIFEGFTTASKKNIEVSEEALNKAKAIFDIDVENERSFSGFKTASNKDIEVSQEALNMAKQIFENEYLSDFKTASNNEIEVLEKDFDNDKFMFDKNENDVGFTTASNKKIEISEEDLSKAKLLFDLNCDMDVHREESISANFTAPSFSAFKTASNKKIEISEENINKGKLMFDLNNMNMSKDPTFSGFKTASNKNIEVSEEDLNNAKLMFDLNDIDMSNESSFNEFKTETNKNIDISEEASNKTQLHLFENEPSFSGCITASNKKIELSEEDLSKGKLIDLNNDMDVNYKVSEAGNESLFIGFKTANNKEIKVSEKDLSKAKLMFDLNDTDVNNDPSFINFKIASNKRIKVSDEELSKAKLKLDLKEELISNFKTVISEEDLNEAKDVLDVDIGTESLFSGFNMASNNKIEVSLNENLNDTAIENIGFKTASNKNINLSEEALNKAKLLFDIDFTNEPSFSGFKTVNNEQIEALNSNDNESSSSNKEIDLSEKDFDCSSWKTVTFDEIDEPEEDDQVIQEPLSLYEIESIIGASVTDVPTLSHLSYEAIKECSNKKTDPVNEEISESIKAFLVDESSSIFNEKDYKSPTKKAEVHNFESGSSPILQFNSINKKRKLKNQQVSAVKRIRLSNESEFKFNENFNTGIERMTLKQLYESSRSNCDSEDRVIDEHIKNIIPQNAIDFIFKGDRVDFLILNQSDCIKAIDMVNVFMNHKDIDEKIVPDGWVLNHIKWIIWKLASYERTLAPNPLLIISNVMNQLKYRYDRELHNIQRPILRKILEKDDVPSKRMVLCVSSIVPVESNLETDVENERLPSKLQKAKYEIELTDGWYSVMTVLDSLLSTAIEKGKIVIGTKLIIHGAELLNCHQGVSPLEDLSIVRLKIWANSCRRCSPWLKLGLYKNSGPLPLKLESCKAGGGPLPKLRIIPLTIYPIFYLNKSSDGSIEMRSEKLQQIHAMKVETEFQAKIESLYAEVEREFSQDNRVKLKSCGNLRKPNIDDAPEDLADMLESAADPNEFLGSLSESQLRAIEKYSVQKKIEIGQNIEKRVKSLMEERGWAKEKPVKVLKARIVTSYNGELSFAILTIWRIDDYVVEAIKEGACLDVTNLTPTGMMKGEYHISGGKRSTFIEVPKNKYLKQFPDLDLYKRSSVRFERFYEPDFIPKFYEVDVVGVVVGIEPKNSDDSSIKYQTVYLVNESKVFLAIIFWGGLKKMGFDKVIVEGSFLVCQNLQYRYKSLPRHIFHLHSTEYSTYTSHPRKTYLRSALNDLEEKLKNTNFNNYLSECSQSLKTILNSPKRYVSKSVFSSKKDIEFDHSLSGLDFDSTFIETSDIYKPNDSKLPSNFISSKINISSILSESNTNFSSPVQKRIDKLRAYGEPSPISPFVIKNSKLVNKPFIIPIMNKSTDSVNSFIGNENKQDDKNESEKFDEDF